MVRYIALVLPIFLCSFLGFFEVSLGLSFGSNNQLKKKGDRPISLGYPWGYQLEIPMETIFMKMDSFL
jgi:hypothetical protein